MLIAAGWLFSGLFTWTLLEYLLHRFVFHERRLGKTLGREHARHHGRVSWFAPWSSKLCLAAVILPPIGAAVALLGGPETSGACLAGITAGWLSYEWLHRRIHVSAPHGPYGRWTRRHHLVHHLEHPNRNYGVTSPLWDWVFGTLSPSETVTVPAAHLPRFPWLHDESASNISPRWASTYRVG